MVRAGFGPNEPDNPSVLDIPAEYRLLDGLWLTYYARRRGWRLQRSATAFQPMQRDGKGLAANLAWQKTEFHCLLAAALT